MKNISALCLVLIIGITSSIAGEVWNVKSNFGGVARHRGTGLAIGNRGYMGLGHFNGAGPNIMFNDWWEFDPGTNTWSQKANYPFPTYAAACFVLGLKGYVGTGVSAGNLFYSYDPIANTWTPIASVPVGATDQIGFAVNGKGYYMYSDQVYEYDPNTDTWTPQGNAPFYPSSWCSSFTIGEKAYVKSGSTLWEYKPTTDQWTIRANFPGLATGGSAAFAVKGKGYIVCGYIGWLSELSNEVWEFDPALNTWTQLEEFPGSGRRFSSGFAIGNKGYVGIGTTGTNMRDFWEFDELLALENSQDAVQIYPNPANHELMILGLPQANIRILDLQGRLVYQDQVMENQIISLDDFSSGTYIIEIETTQTRITKKLVVQK